MYFEVTFNALWTGNALINLLSNILCSITHLCYSESDIAMLSGPYSQALILYIWGRTSSVNLKLHSYLWVSSIECFSIFILNLIERNSFWNFFWLYTVQYLALFSPSLKSVWSRNINIDNFHRKTKQKKPVVCTVFLDQLWLPDQEVIANKIFTKLPIADWWLVSIICSSCHP